MLSLEPTDNGEKCPNCGESIASAESSVNPQCPGCGVYLNKIKKREEQDVQSSNNSKTVGVQRAHVPVSENPAVKYLVALAIVIATVFGIKYAITESGRSAGYFDGITSLNSQSDGSAYDAATLDIDYVAQSEKVELYVFSSCKWGGVARDGLKRRNIDFIEYDFKKSEHGKFFYSKLKKQYRVSPVYVVDDKVILGVNTELVLQILDERSLSK